MIVEMTKIHAEDDLVFSEWPNRKNQNFTSPEAQNEILKEMSLSILRVFLSLIKTPNFTVLW